MGDRSNIFIQHAQREDGTWSGVGMYSHWGGTTFQKLALQELGSDPVQARIGDPPYFTRVLFQRIMAQAFDPNADNGGGIWIDYLPDNEHDILVINATTGRYWYVAYSWQDTDPKWTRSDPGPPPRA